MAFPSVQFVDAPSGSANVRYDFNDVDAFGRTHPLGADGLDLGVPAFTGEPEGVGFDYGYRPIRLTQRIEGPRDLAWTKMSLLAREVLRATNWLRVQWESGAAPVYFKTFRGEPGAISLEHGDTAGVWDVAVPLTAEGFAYGERETIPTVQIIQAPADLAGPTRYAMRYALPAIKGDAPTGLRVAVTPASPTLAGFGSEWLIGCASGTSIMTDPVYNYGTGDGWSTGADAAPVTTGDSAFFNSDYRTLTLPGTDPNKLDINFALSVRGRYKVLLRGEFPASNTYLFALAQTGLPTPAYQSVTVGSSGAYVGWLDIGDYTFPAGASLPDDLNLSPPAGFVILRGSRVSGSGTVKVDALKLIPVAGPSVVRATLLRAKFPTLGFLYSYAYTVTYDADTETVWGTGSGSNVGHGPISLRGTFPTADPSAAQNLLEVVAIYPGDSPGSPTVTAVNAQAAVDVSYHPRYLYVGGDA